MPLFAFLHPIWQIGVFILGVLVAHIGMQKKSLVKAFPLKRHRTLGWIFLILIVLGAFLGKVINNNLKAHAIQLKLSGHQPIGIIIIGLVALAIIFSEVGITNRKKFAGILGWHPWLNILALGFLVAQAFIGILALIEYK
jgi:heme A synthase